MFQEDEARNMLHASAQKLAAVISQDQAKEQDLLPLSAREQQIQQELEEHAKTVEAKMHDGLRVAVLALKECQNPVMPFTDLVHELQHCLNSIDSSEKFTNLGQACLSETTWKDQLGISEKLLSGLYQGAKAVFEKKEYEQAEKAFFVLCSLTPYHFSYWIGLGHSALQNRNYRQAAAAYGMASTLRPDDAWPHIWAANAFEEQNDVTHAKMALSEALQIEKSKEKQDHELIASLQQRLHMNKGYEL